MTQVSPSIAPAVGPENVSIAEVNKTAWNISWVAIPREKSYGKILVYEVKQTLLSRVQRSRRSTLNTKEINSTKTHVVLNGLSLCAQYNVSVRAFTGAGPGPDSRKPLITSRKLPETETFDSHTHGNQKYRIKTFLGYSQLVVRTDIAQMLYNKVLFAVWKTKTFAAF